MEASRSSERSPQGRLDSGDSDPYSTAVVQELLQSGGDWVNIQDIVKLTFKALFDQVRTQADAIKDLERVISSKASKCELNSGLTQKANVSDVSRTVATVAATIEARASVEDVQALLEDRVTKRELQRAVEDKVGLNDVRAVVEKCVSRDEFGVEIQNVLGKMEELRKALSAKTAASANIRDVEELKAQLEQKANITDVNSGLQQKASKESVANALKRKVNVADLELALNKKAETEDVNRILQSLELKVDSAPLEELQEKFVAQVSQLESLKSEVVTKSSPQYLESTLEKRLTELQKSQEQKAASIQTELAAFKQRADEDIAALNRNLATKADTGELEKLKTSVERKADIDKTGSELVEARTVANEAVKQTNAKVDAVVQRLDELKSVSQRGVDGNAADLTKLKEQQQTNYTELKQMCEKARMMIESNTGQLKSETQDEQYEIKKTIVEIRKELEEMDQKKTDRKEIAELNASFAELLEPKANLADVQEELNKRLADAKAELGATIQTAKTGLQTQIDLRATESEVAAKLEAKVDKTTLEEELRVRPSITELEGVRTNLDATLGEMEKKLDANAFSEFAAEVRLQVDRLTKELPLKANVKDVYALLDTKAAQEDTSKALTEMHKELERRAMREDVTSALADQALVNEALCAENCVGRWLWKSGELKNEYAVPWEIQSVNTCPDNFLWEKDRVSVMTVAPGLYEITMGFFTKKKPTVQLLINGEAVLSAVNSASYVIHHSSGKIKSVGKHSAGNVTGSNSSITADRTHADRLHRAPIPC